MLVFFLQPCWIINWKTSYPFFALFQLFSFCAITFLTCWHALFITVLNYSKKNQPFIAFLKSRGTHFSIHEQFSVERMFFIEYYYSYHVPMLHQEPLSFMPKFGNNSSWSLQFSEVITKNIATCCMQNTLSNFKTVFRNKKKGQLSILCI